MPYFQPEDIPEPFCDGRLKELGWEGTWDDPAKPIEVRCRSAKLIWSLISKSIPYEKREKFFLLVCRVIFAERRFEADWSVVGWTIRILLSPAHL